MRELTEAEKWMGFRIVFLACVLVCLRVANGCLTYHVVFMCLKHVCIHKNQRHWRENLWGISCQSGDCCDSLSELIQSICRPRMKRAPLGHSTVWDQDQQGRRAWAYWILTARKPSNSSSDPERGRRPQYIKETEYLTRIKLSWTKLRTWTRQKNVKFMQKRHVGKGVIIKNIGILEFRCIWSLDL